MHGTIIHNDWKYSYALSSEAKDAIINRLLDYYSKHGTSGEVLMQDDDAQTFAPDVLADIADELICFQDAGEVDDV